MALADAPVASAAHATGIGVAAAVGAAMCPPMHCEFAPPKSPEFVVDPVMQNQPEEPAKPMGNCSDGWIVSHARYLSAIHDLEDAAFVLDHSVGSLIDNSPHVAIALGGAVAVVHSRALLVA